jgi:quinol monooxygenase YgiN
MTEWLVHAKPLLFGALMLAASAVSQARAEERQAGYVQLAELDIDPAQLESYEAAAKEQIETAIRVEPGVLALYSVADKNNPSHIRVFELYRDLDAYKVHLESAHFKKYKTATQAMVKSLNLVPMNPIILDAK